MSEVRQPKRPAYQPPEIVQVGSVTELTNGMGGDSKDMDGYTIPVRPRREPRDADSGDAID